jgi:hypothetical protein
MTTIFHIHGGSGKHVAGANVVHSYKKRHPSKDIVVVSAYPEIFEGSSDVLRSYRLGNVPYFYRDYVYGKDIEVFGHDPYMTTSHITQQKNLIDSWCKLVGVDRSFTYKLNINFREREFANRLINNPDGKKVLIFQPFGGPPGSEMPYSWTRDIHPQTAQQIVNTLVNEYHIVHICHPHHPQLNGVQRIDTQLQKRILFAMLPLADKRLLIDSSLQHAAAAQQLPSTVCWVATNPKIFGYDIHTNLVPTTIYSEGTSASYLYDYNFGGDISECPYSHPSEIYTASDIISKL